MLGACFARWGAESSAALEDFKKRSLAVKKGRRVAKWVKTDLLVPLGSHAAVVH